MSIYDDILPYDRASAQRERERETEEVGVELTGGAGNSRAGGLGPL